MEGNLFVEEEVLALAAFSRRCSSQNKPGWSIDSVSTSSAFTESSLLEAAMMSSHGQLTVANLR